MREPIILHDHVDVRALPVPLDARAGAGVERIVRAKAGRHFALRRDEVRIPVDEVADDVRTAHPEKHGRGHASVADPGALVLAGSGLDRRPVLIDEDVGELRLQRVRDILRGQIDRDAIHLPRPEALEAPALVFKRGDNVRFRAGDARVDAGEQQKNPRQSPEPTALHSVSPPP